MASSIADRRLQWQLNELAQAWGNRYGKELVHKQYVAWGIAYLFLEHEDEGWIFTLRGGNKSLLEASPYLLYNGYFKALHDKLEKLLDKKTASDRSISRLNQLLKDKGATHTALYLLEEQNEYLTSKDTPS